MHVYHEIRDVIYGLQCVLGLFVL